MAADDIRARYLSDRVLTASPAQRVVMLYDRLGLDIARAQDAHARNDLAAVGSHLNHAVQIIAELRSSLDITTWSGGENLASIYTYLLTNLMSAARADGAGQLPHLAKIVTDLRAAWHQAAEELNENAGTATLRVPTRVA